MTRGRAEGSRCLYLNRIEKCGANVRTILRKLKARTFSAHLDVLRDARFSVDADGIIYGWFDRIRSVPV